MTQGERVKRIRDSLHFTKKEFASILSVGVTEVDKIEKGETSLSDMQIKLLCREFGINYDWLVYEEGEILTDAKKGALKVVLEGFSCDNADFLLILRYLELSPNDRKKVQRLLKNKHFLDIIA